MSGLVGVPAPEFELPAHDCIQVSLADQQGSWILLWWFPKASTPTCTREGRALRSEAPAFHARDCTVLGLSFDTPADNAAFASEHDFPFQLLSDMDRVASTAYDTVKAPDEDAWPDMPRRRSVLIDPDGIVRAVYTVIDVEAHPAEVLADIDRFENR